MRVLVSIPALLALLAGGGVHAAIYDFSWTGDPAEDPTIVSSDDSTLRANGTIEIDTLPGETFALSDILSTNISVTGDTIADFVLTSWVQAGGSIAADGSSAVFSAAGNPYYSSPSAGFFGCSFVGCSNGEIDVDSPGVDNVVGYGNDAQALASMRMTQAVPAPATLALLMAGIIGIRYARKRSV